MKRVFVYLMLTTLLFSYSCLLVSLVGNVQAAENSVISFLSNENGNYDIFLIDTDGNVLQRYPTDSMRKSNLTCSPNGYLFAYSSNEHGDPDIYKMDIRNNKPIQLTHHPDRDLGPSWSPNGEWIAFVSDREGTLNIYRMDVNGSNIIRLTDQGIDGKPAWSPDSQLIAFDSQREGHHAIYIMNANGGQLKQLTEDMPLWPGCSWSPDGTQIAYAAGRFDEEGADIFTIDVDGNTMKKLTSMGSGFRSDNTAWSPDGKRIAFSVVNVAEWPNPANGFRLIFSDSTIYLVDSSGNGDALPLEKTTGLSSNHAPVWTSQSFFAVTPDESKQIITWGKLRTLGSE